MGDKTLVDVLAPASDALTATVAGGQGLAAAMEAAAEVADKRRAGHRRPDCPDRAGPPLAEKSLGTPDAGAVSLALRVQRRQPAALDRHSNDSRI